MRIGGRLVERYGLALLLLVVALVYSIAVPEGDWERLVAMALQGTALFATLSAAEAGGRILRFFLAILLVALIAAVLQAGLSVGDGVAFVRVCVLAILLLALPLVGSGLIRQVRFERKITVHTMMGVLCAYLLLLSAFAYAYAVLGELGGEPFFDQGPQWNDLGDYVYFSVTTITTVGMGDLTPSGDLGRSLTAAEALIGQIYMVTVVAVIVSNLGRSEPRRKASDTASPPADRDTDAKSESGSDG